MKEACSLTQAAGPRHCLILGLKERMTALGQWWLAWWGMSPSARTEVCIQGTFWEARDLFGSFL